jgi:hypothetical protein
MARHHTAKIASGKERTANINMETINASKYALEIHIRCSNRSQNAIGPLLARLGIPPMSPDIEYSTG